LQDFLHRCHVFDAFLPHADQQVGAMQNGRIVWMRPFGWRNGRRGTPAMVKTRYA